MFWRNRDKLSGTPLGGVEGYVGHNCFLYETGNSAVVVDCGIKPQTHEEGGQEEEAWRDPPPRLDILDDVLKGGKKAIGVVTHAHPDHIGAVRELALRRIPVHLSRWSKIFMERYAENLKIPVGAKFYVFEGGHAFRHGDFEVSFIPVPHSIPGTHAVLLRMGKKSILHLSDFKFNGMQESREETSRIFREIRRNVGRINCLVLDVLNAEMEGFTPPEQLVLDSIEKIAREARGRVIITFFASNLRRMEGILKIAESFHKTVGIAGWGMNSSYAMLGKDDPAKDGSILLIGGSQGEENSGLTKMAFGEHKYLHLSSRDTVVGLFRSIPGNEGGIRAQLDNIHGSGAGIILHEGEPAKLNLSFKPQEMFLHVSGHEQGEGLLEAVDIFNPEVVIPFHAPPGKSQLFKEIVGKRVRCLGVGDKLEV